MICIRTPLILLTFRCGDRRGRAVPDRCFAGERALSRGLYLGRVYGRYHVMLMERGSLGEIFLVRGV